MAATSQCDRGHVGPVTVAGAVGQVARRADACRVQRALGDARDNLEVRAGERVRGVPEDALTPAWSWSCGSLTSRWRQVRDQAHPWWWDVSIHVFRTGLDNAAAALDNFSQSTAGTRRRAKVGFAAPALSASEQHPLPHLGVALPFMQCNRRRDWLVAHMPVTPRAGVRMHILALYRVQNPRRTVCRSLPVSPFPVTACCAACSTIRTVKFPFLRFSEFLKRFVINVYLHQATTSENVISVHHYPFCEPAALPFLPYRCCRTDAMS